MDPSLKNKLRTGQPPTVDRPREPTVQQKKDKRPPTDARAAEIAEHELPPDLDAALVAQYERFASAFDFLDRQVDEAADLMAAIARTGSVREATDVPKEVRRVFVTALDISPEWHVRMQAIFQGVFPRPKGGWTGAIRFIWWITGVMGKAGEISGMGMI